MARGEYETTTRFIEIAHKILKEQHPMIIRQLFYAMLGLPENVKLELGGFKNDEHDYKRVSRMMKKARMDGRIPWDWIVEVKRFK